MDSTARSDTADVLSGRSHYSAFWKITSCNGRNCSIAHNVTVLPHAIFLPIHRLYTCESDICKNFIYRSLRLNGENAMTNKNRWFENLQVQSRLFVYFVWCKPTTSFRIGSALPFNLKHNWWSYRSSRHTNEHSLTHSRTHARTHFWPLQNSCCIENWLLRLAAPTFYGRCKYSTGTDAYIHTCTQTYTCSWGSQAQRVGGSNTLYRCERRLYTAIPFFR